MGGGKVYEWGGKLYEGWLFVCGFFLIAFIPIYLELSPVS